jgi:hypothetical protein
MTYNQEPHANGCLYSCGGLIFFAVLAVLAWYTIGNITGNRGNIEIPKQIAEDKQQAVKSWFLGGSKYSCEEELKKQLKDPNSYQRATDFETLFDNGNEKEISWNFRSKNGFGGYGLANAKCSISTEKEGTVRAFIVE